MNIVGRRRGVVEILTDVGVLGLVGDHPGEDTVHHPVRAFVISCGRESSKCSARNGVGG
jgi:hypothetical protein